LTPIKVAAQYAIACSGGIDFNGYNVTVDSFDSADPFHSYWPNYPIGRGYGIYTNTGTTANAIRKANGNVATSGSLVGIISVGNAQIYGSVTTGSGGTAQISSQGSVGSISWVASGNAGIESGHVFNNFHTSFPAVILPSVVWTNLPKNQNITNSGYFTMDQIDGNMAIGGSNAISVVLYLTNGINLSGSKLLTIKTNTSVTIYAGNTIRLISSASIFNSSQHASQLAIYGLTNLNTINMSSSGTFWGMIYAPSASTSYSGGGAGAGFYGSLICSDLRITGNCTFSYDEVLRFYSPPVSLGISIQPTNQIIATGNPVALTAYYSYGNTPMSYQWYFNQGLIPDATNYALSFNPAYVSHSGSYTVVATNLSGSYTSGPASLLVYTNAAATLAAPSISSDGAKFQLTGVPGLNYQIQSSSNLIDWTTLLTNTAPFTFTDAPANPSPQLFYRAVAQP
jgi:hypothetical protein